MRRIICIAFISILGGQAHAGMSDKSMTKFFDDQRVYGFKCADENLANMKAKGVTVTEKEYYKDVANCQMIWTVQHRPEYDDIPDNY
jgi:hypothetical protein